jgi:hypothetical protein
MLKLKIKNSQVLNEANVTSLIQRFKIPSELANYANEKYRKNVDALLEIFMDRYGKHLPPKRIDGSYHQEDVEEHIKEFKSFEEFRGKILDKFLTKFPKKKQEIISLAKTDWRDFLKSLRDFTEEINIKENLIIKFPDGSYWVKLPQEDYRRCGIEMQHCGQPMAEDGEIYQLFSKENKWLVTIEMRPNKEVFQIKGKQNEFPDSKYWDYVFGFLKHFKVEKIVEILMPPDFEISYYDSMESSLKEARLSKIWKKRAKARAKRQMRQYDKSDLKWAHKRQTELHKKHPELEEQYLKEIESASKLAEATREYLNKIREIRKQRIEAKRKGGMPPKFGPGTPEKADGSISVPLKPIHDKGVAGGYKQKARKLKAKKRGSATIAPGESFGSMEE